MKKLLLSLLCGFSIATSSAGIYTYTMADVFGSGENSVESWTCDNFVFTTAKNDGTNDPTYNANGQDVRIYAKGSLTVSTIVGENVNGISFAISVQGMKRLTDIYPETGEIVEQGQNPLVWVCDPCGGTTFTVGDKAVYGSDGSSKAGQFDFSALTIYTGEDKPDTNVTPPPTPEQPETVYGISALYDFNKGDAFTMGVDLTVVYANGANIYVYDGQSYGLIFKYDLDLKAGDLIEKGWTGKIEIYNELMELVPDVALTAAGTAEIPEPYELDADMASVSLIPSNQNMYIKLLGVTFADNTPAGASSFTGVMGEGEDAYTVNFYNKFKIEAVTAGTYDVVAFINLYKTNVQVYPVEYIGTSGEVETPTIDSFSAIYDFEKGTEFIVGVDTKVIYASGAYTYVNDGYQNALIYKKGLGLEAGDVVAKDWKATLDIYNELYEIIPAEELTVSEKGAEIPAPMDVEAEDVNMFVAPYNQALYIRLMGVTFENDTPASGAFTGTMGEETVNFYQRFGLGSVEAGVYNVSGFVAVYKNDAQVYPTQFDKVAGIEGIEAENAHAKYYNIQGMEINNPQPGQLYIRVSGNDAKKVIIR